LVWYSINAHTASRDGSKHQACSSSSQGSFRLPETAGRASQPALLVGALGVAIRRPHLGVEIVRRGKRGNVANDLLDQPLAFVAPAALQRHARQAQPGVRVARHQSEPLAVVVPGRVELAGLELPFGQVQPSRRVIRRQLHGLPQERDRSGVVARRAAQVGQIVAPARLARLGRMQVRQQASASLLNPLAWYSRPSSSTPSPGCAAATAACSAARNAAPKAAGCVETSGSGGSSARRCSSLAC
jgi:hypothetical protein